MKILLVNDDGIDSVSLDRLASELNRQYDITIVAPAAECSAFSHYLSINKKWFCSNERDEMELWMTD